jgi:hypothetical protein
MDDEFTVVIDNVHVRCYPSCATRPIYSMHFTESTAVARTRVARGMFQLIQRDLGLNDGCTFDETPDKVILQRKQPSSISLHVSRMESLPLTNEQSSATVVANMRCLAFPKVDPLPSNPWSLLDPRGLRDERFASSHGESCAVGQGADSRVEFDV